MTDVNQALVKTVDWIETNGLAVGLGVIAVTGFGLGFGTDSTDNIPAPYNRISSIVGWIYFACWSVSFWPQVFLNWRRQSVVGLSLDFLVYNILGFLCYAIFNCAFFWNDTVQREYAKFHDGHRNAVQVNDVFFALHAVFVTIFTYYQTTIYTRGGQVVSTTCKTIVGGSLIVSAVFFLLGYIVNSEVLSALNFLYLLSYVKLGVSLVKYIPQVILNYERKSTAGWTIWNVLLDFTGGMLSMAQIIMTSAVTNDWSAITGDPVKFGLGFTSVFFDIIFIVQHYVLYPEAAVTPLENEEAPLLKA
ncbi:unnamed protein product [Aphanomyces euteiches]|uniref:Uncharacterized protein n=1 Tax=Aphanomyces euteiches TaxID=100861 RepID=A0A6G0WBP7_9STRA|nr:hypothetical protein Ae201684_016751 [Aphanomyces euteiches]KAH9083075.1 hypothetical protein Ae201684P_013976 [Aphanomyces euteiches]KAH9135286.1 hypothetical protein AeRB84_019259 [Aphanomyces euteiches]KAH9147606.1 hypothetical protein AeRB84_008846 [Aphanomyces euteiches]KAH9148943.1 hypothetical protein AeRB84_007837 [Aphanomyces euteiches]